MRAIRHGGWLLIATALAASGCERAAFRTEVHGDGSWTRSERFLACNETELKEVFALPEGAGWMTMPTAEKEGAGRTARRTFRTGQPLRQDLVRTCDEAGAIIPRLRSEVTIRQEGAHGWQYREVLRWHGPQPKPLVERERELRRLLREGLPDGLASEEDLQALVRRIVREGWRHLAGPGEGWMAGVVHEEYAERQMQRRLGLAIDRVLVGKFGRRLTHEARRGLVQKLVAAFPLMAGEEIEGWFDENEAGRVPLMFAVKMPGRVVDTNGEYDPVAGEVLWGLVAAAPALEDVVLTATSEQDREKENGDACRGR